MAVTLTQMVEQVRAQLNQGLTNRSIHCTFNGWVLDGADKVGIQLTDVPSGLAVKSVVVELGHELVFVTSLDANTSTATCPAWFRQYQGSPANDDYEAGSMATLSPLWPYWLVAQKVVEGIGALYPALFQVKTTTLTASAVAEKYLLPNDVEDILNIKVEYSGGARGQRKIGEWSIDTKAADGNRYLHIRQGHPSGWSIYVTYRAKPVVPTVTSGSTTWTSTGLPDSASDLPVLYALAMLMPSTDAAKTQTASMEQSERSRFVQAGSGNSTSRHYMTLFKDRLAEERRRLLDRYPPRIHKELNG